MASVSDGSLPPEKKDLLINKRSVLLAKIKVSPFFWATLEKHDVMKHTDVENIASNAAVPEIKQIDELIRHLLAGKVSWYRGFLQTLVDTGQGHIVTQVLGEKIPDTPQQAQQTQPQVNNDDRISCDKYRLLTQKSLSLKKQVKLSAEFWDNLKESSGTSWTKFKLHQCTEENLSQDSQMTDLLNDLRRGTNGMYQGFIHALIHTGQKDVVTKVLGEPLPQPIKTPVLLKVDGERLLPLEKEELLVNKTPDLIQKIKPTDELLASLVKHCVISEDDEQDIRTGRGSDEEKTTEVLEQLRRGTEGHFDGFVKALLEANQSAVVTQVLGEDLADHKVMYKEPELPVGILTESVEKLKQYLHEKDRAYLQEFSTVSQDVDLEHIYTSLHITQITQGAEGKTLTGDDLLRRDDEDTCCLTLCVGKVGTGKTALTMRLAHLWAKHDQHDTYFWSKIKAVLLIECTHEKNNFRQTMRNAIPGKKACKDAIIELYKTEPMSVLFVVEAFDCFTNESVVQDIQKLLRDKATNVLLTIREDSPYLTSTFIRYFGQSVSIRGFNPTQALECAGKLIQVLGCAYEEDELRKAVEWKPWFYTNPLNLSLACQIYAEGKVDISKQDIMTEVHLYRTRELRMLEREMLGQNEPKIEDNITKTSTSEIQKIHSLALKLVCSHRSECTKDDLESEDIAGGSPLRVLLELEKVHTAKSGTQCRWRWPHTRLQQFDAAMAVVNMDKVKQAEWLYMASSRSDLNAVVQFVDAVHQTEDNFLNTE